MKRILSFYIIREISSIFLLGIVIFTMVLLMGRLISLTDLVVSHGVPLRDVAMMILYLIPSFFVFTIPMAFLLAVLLSFGRLSTDNEIVVLKSGGISLLQMIPPVIVCAVCAVLLALGFSTLGVPWGNSAFKELSFRVLKQNISATIRERIFWDEIPGVVMYTDHYDEQNHHLKGVIIHDGRNSSRPMTIFAQDGTLSTPPGMESLLLTLQDGSIHMGVTGGPYRLVHFGEYRLSVGENSGGRSISRSESDLWLSELTRNIDSAATDEKNRLKLLTEFHSRFTFPFASLVFALVAVPLGIQNRRSGKSAGFTVSIALIITYYVLMSVARTVAEKGSLPPFIVLWLPNILFFAAGVYFLRLSSKEKTIPMPSVKNIIAYFRNSSR